MDSHIVATRYWHRLEDGRLQCDLCPRECKMREGQRGLCFVRENRNGQVVLTSYGLSSGFCIDPIEKKPLNHFLPGTPVLSFGTAGCNLACKFCQNWDISKSREQHTLASQAMPGEIARAAAEHGCRSVAYTYNDPVIFAEYAIDVAQACAEVGIRSVAVSAGYHSPAPRAEFYRHMDAVNIDLKAFDDKFYWKLTGGHLEPVLDTLKYIHHETRVWLEITTLLIPGENDSDAELEAAAGWVADHLGPDVPWHFTAFHPDWKMTDYPSTPASTLHRARRIAMRHGLRYVYVGNLYDAVAGSTWCPECGELLIERDGYTLGRWGLDARGACARCGNTLPGVFEPRPGKWGSRRLALRFPRPDAAAPGGA